jgi:hypothetical protein
MAITIQQSPTQPNMVNNNLLYAVTSNSSSAPQFQYVADLTLSGSNTVLQRVKQQPNPNAVGVFDMGAIISNYLDSDNNWKAAPFATASQAAKRFQVKFGEEYGTSSSSSVILYTGVAAVSGSPAVTASNYLYTANGLVDPNDKINWNFPSASYFTGSAVSTTTTFSKQYALTNAPLTQSIQDGEYATISLFNGNFNGSSTAAQDIYIVDVTVYDATGSEIDQFDLANLVGNGGGPRANGTQVWSAVATSQSAGTQLLTVGIGPQNLANDGNTLPSDWAYYTVKALGQQSAGVKNESGSYASLTFVKQGAQCGYDGVRFAWKNEFGVWDYYTFTLQTDKGYSIERANYEQTFVPYNSINPVPYSKERRGTINYYNKPTQTQTANSNWLTQAESDWLRELFFSANVFQQIDGDFYPVVITSVDLTEKTNPRTQKTFQYAISFQVANQINPRI